MEDLVGLRQALGQRYTVERELGRGGMATVYLAEDVRHHRKVAIKVLLPELSALLGMERFLKEIELTASLQHPHILPLFDSGEVDGCVYYVMPFVAGETLRAKLDRERQLPIDEAVRIAREVGDALAYAHKHGVVHRDIKPENILLHDGHAQVADFGIALAVQQAGGKRITESGISVGTPKYMAPEQAMGDKAIDARADIYALGAVLFEMLAGEPPFTGPTAQSIVARVLTETARPLRALRHTVPEHVATAAAIALEKLPADRFAGATQFADALVRAETTPSGGRVVGVAVKSPWLRDRRSLAAVAVALIAVIACAILAMRLGTARADARRNVVFAPKTFDPQAIFTARFAGDGQTIVFSAAPEGHLPRIYVINPEYAEPRPLTDFGVHLFSVSSRNEMAVVTSTTYQSHRLFLGVLGTMPMRGGAPRRLLENVRDADWSPDGSQMAVVHAVNGKDRLEYPIGRTLYEVSHGYLSDVRVSPRGDHLAFFRHSFGASDDRGDVMTIDLAGKAAALTGEYTALEGLAWSPDGNRVFFSGYDSLSSYQARSVGFKGDEHVALATAGNLLVHDVARDGRALVTRVESQFRMMVRPPDAANSEHDLSWLDHSASPLLSRDGKLLVFSDQGMDAGPNYAVMLRVTDGSPAVRLGEGFPNDLSPDNRWVLARVPSKPPRLMLYPTGVGEVRRLDHGEFSNLLQAAFAADGEHVFLCGAEGVKPDRCYVQSLTDGARRPISREGTSRILPSPDGVTMLVRNALGDGTIERIDGTGTPRQLSDSIMANVVRWSPDGRALWVRGDSGLAVKIDRVDVASGQRTPLVVVEARNKFGLLTYTGISLADDPRVMAYQVWRYLSELYVVSGMK